MRTVQSAPSTYSVLEKIGPSDGNKTTVYLTENPAAMFPRELRQDLCEHIDRSLSSKQIVEVSEHVPYKMRNRERAFAKIVFVGVLPSKALTLVRKAKAWFLESLVPPVVKRAEKALRLQRCQTLRASRRRQRHMGRRLCHSYKQRFA